MSDDLLTALMVLAFALSMAAPIGIELLMAWFRRRWLARAQSKCSCRMTEICLWMGDCKVHR